MENIITLTTGQKIEVLMQDEVSLDIDCSLRYIESGKKELERYVEEISKKRLNTIVDDAKTVMDNQITAGIIDAQEKASSSAKEVIDENIFSMKTEITDYVNNDLKPQIEKAKQEAIQSADIALQAATSATSAYDNLSSSLELAQEVACGNIGDIKYTLRTTPPHGGIFCNGQILSEEQYPDLYQMLLDNKLNKISLTEYENQISNDGSCSFFAIDETSHTIKVPTIISANSEYNAYVVCYTGKDTEIDITDEIKLNNPFSLLDYKWSEYEINNASWLLSNGAFHSGTVYKAVYELLLKIKNGTETKDGVSVKLSTEAYEDTDFVLNTSNTTFRLPVKVKLASGNAVVGNDMTLGFTDGTNIISQKASSNYSIQYAEYQNAIGTQTSGGTINQGVTLGITTDPTKSGIETTSSGLKLYFYVGETIQDANVIVASKVLTAVADCVRKSSLTDRETVIGWGMPDYTAGISIAVPTSSAPYTAPCSGIYLITYQGGKNTSGKVLQVNGGNAYQFQYTSAANPIFNGVVNLDKGDVLSSDTTSTPSEVHISIFYPFKGAN